MFYTGFFENIYARKYIEINFFVEVFVLYLSLLDFCNAVSQGSELTFLVYSVF